MDAGASRLIITEISLQQFCRESEDRYSFEPLGGKEEDIKATGNFSHSIH
jgi:hypothetical protein